MISVRRLLPPARLTAAVLAAACLLAAEPGPAQGPPDQIFRIDYGREAVPRGGWAVEGYVNNDSRYRVSGVRLRVQVLDESGAVVGESFGWVYGNVLAGGRAYFAVRVPQRGADYRITVVSYTPVSLDAP